HPGYAPVPETINREPKTMRPVIHPRPTGSGRPRHAALVACMTAMVLGGCTSAAGPESGADPNAEADRSAQAHPELWPAMHSPVPEDPALERRVQQLLARMTVEEKVGQVVQGDIGSVTPEDVRKYRL